MGYQNDFDPDNKVAKLSQVLAHLREYRPITILDLEICSMFFTAHVNEKNLAKEKRKIRKEKLDAKKALQCRLLFDVAILLESCSLAADEDELPRFIDVEVEHSISLGIKKFDFGAPDRTCKCCGVIVWHQERSKGSTIDLEFSICCSKGNVRLPLFRDAPEYLKRLLDFNGGPLSRKFRNSIRAYNSMLAFTSTGARFDNKHNRRGKGPWTYRIQGQSYHKIGSLVLPRNKDPGYNQLYVCDTELAHEALRRIFKQTQQDDLGVDGAQKKKNADTVQMKNANKKNGHEQHMESKTPKKSDSELGLGVITGLITMMDQNNPHAKTFRTAKHRMQSQPIVELRDIIVEHKENGYTRIKEIHPCYMPMQFPLLFPYGEDGNIDTPYRNVKIGKDGVIRKRQQLTMREYYAFRLQQRL
ncbi:uncharacterized protein LOC113306299 [Papaver somniferum]|uniref:uncharacterized protein LOC113306299 n=1 Tax=Papaver somniferum TaxID=3469 RepID=UPI000E6F7506|nr:uncharacterized protein LOC113306299 [Papaver somniferum]